VVREDLTILAVEKKDPLYKGRTFNKMMNNGSKGQYISRSDDKMRWHGVPSMKIPSYYTSVTDWETACVDKNQRKGKKFTTKSGVVWDADVHAAEMIARWVFLRPKCEGNGSASGAAL
jgi:transposase